MVLMVVVTLLICVAGAEFAGTSKADAEGLVKKAVAFFKAKGKDKTFVEINNPKGQFVKGGLYVFANNFSGVALAHGGNSKLMIPDVGSCSINKRTIVNSP